MRRRWFIGMGMLERPRGSACKRAMGSTGWNGVNPPIVWLVFSLIWRYGDINGVLGFVVRMVVESGAIEFYLMVLITGTDHLPRAAYINTTR